MYAFLSEEWIEAARAIRERYAEGHTPPESVISVRINQIITDVPFDDGVVLAYIDTSSGDLALELGELDAPDAVITTDYEVAKSMIVNPDPALLMQAFLEGRIKVQGDMTRLLALQTAIPAGDGADGLAAEIQAITV